MEPPIREPLVLTDRCLAVFVDDTGHEALAKGHPVYGLGGCAALGRDVERIIQLPWKELRRRVTGSPDTQLHAADFPRIAKAGDFEAVGDFFYVQPFWRFGAVFTIKTKLADEISLLRTMKGVLEKRINYIVQMTLCKEVQVVIESSDRANKLIEDTFQNFEFSRGSKRIPSECGFMSKSAAEPALEVADFVMHAIGRQTRHNLEQRGNPKQRGSFVADFCAVFHSVAPKLTSFIEVENVTVGAPIEL
jgi:Protein of unknown function (DUF3800)